jgi:hypothetical protein
MRPLRVPAFLASMVLLLPAARLGDDAPLRGFTAESARAERHWEEKFRAAAEPDSMREAMLFLSARAHHVGWVRDSLNA